MEQVQTNMPLDVRVRRTSTTFGSQSQDPFWIRYILDESTVLTKIKPDETVIACGKVLIPFDRY